MIITISVWAVIIATLPAAFIVRGRSLPIQIALHTAAIVTLSAFLIPLVGSTLHPVFPLEDGSAAIAPRIFVAIWWLFAARLIVMGGRFAYDHQERASRLVFDLLSAAINIGAILTIANIAFGLSVTSLVATSGIIAIVLGLALQSTLGDLFSGIAISVEKPFTIGDYIWIEGAMEGSVIETNWRSTRLHTDTNDIATIPNSVVAKGRVLNRSRPTETRTDTIRIVLDPSIVPERGINLLRAAVLNTHGLAKTPASRILCAEVKGEGTSYDLSYSAPRHLLQRVRSELLNNVVKHTRLAGVALAMQNGMPISLSAPDPVRLLSGTGLFPGLSEAELRSLASELLTRRGRKGETLFEQGGSKATLFIIVEGVFEVFLGEGHLSQPLGNIAPGDHVGELSLLIGAENPATVRSLTSFLVYEVTKSSLANYMRDNPNVLQAIKAGAESSKHTIDLLSASRAAVEAGPVNFIDRIKAFLDLPL